MVLCQAPLRGNGTFLQYNMHLFQRHLFPPLAIHFPGIISKIYPSAWFPAYTCIRCTYSVFTPVVRWCLRDVAASVFWVRSPLNWVLIVPRSL